MIRAFANSVLILVSHDDMLTSGKWKIGENRDRHRFPMTFGRFKNGACPYFLKRDEIERIMERARRKLSS